MQEIDLNSVIKLQKVEESACRICYEPESEANLLITPCKCSGSMKYVHEECLKIWILSSGQDMKSSICDICKNPFSMEISLKRVCSCKNLKDECFKLLIFPLVIVLISTIFSIVVIYLIKGMVDGTVTVEEKVYYSLVIFACSLIVLTLLYIFGRTMLNACSVLKVKDWNIKNMKAEIFNETFDVTHHTELSNREEISHVRNDRNMVVVPGTARFRGRNIVIPEISPVTLIRVQESGTVVYSRHDTSRSRSVPMTARNNEPNVDEDAEPLSTNRYRK